MEISQVKPVIQPSNPTIPRTAALPVQPTEPILKKITNEKNDKAMLVGISTLAIVLGVLSGFSISNLVVTSSTSVAQEEIMSAGTNDESLLTDSTEGVLKEGGINDEGTHRINDVTLISTVLDLDNFVGKKVTIWGLAIGSPNVDWLIDVAKIKVQN